jgi:hypothetical protein
MTGANVANYARTLLNRNSTTFTDEEALTLLNVAYGKRILDILRTEVDRNAQITEAATTLLSTEGLSPGDNGYMGEYAFPSDLVKPLRVEVSYDGVSWNKCRIYDLNENLASEATEDSINRTFSTNHPYVEFSRNSFFIRPLKTTPGDISEGIRIWYELRQAELPTLASTPDLEPNLHDVLAFDIAEVKALNQSQSYDAKWWNLFNKMKAEAENKFFQFYKSQMKRNKGITVKRDRYK